MDHFNDKMQFAVTAVIRESDAKRIQVCLTYKIDPFAFMPEDTSFDLHVPSVLRSWQAFADAKPLQEFVPQPGALLIMHARVRKGHVTLLNAPLINKALELTQHSHLLLLMPSKVLPSVGSKLGQVKVYDLGERVGLYCAPGSLLPKLIPCTEPYSPEKSSINHCTLQHFHDLKPRSALLDVPFPPQLDYQLLEFYCQPHWAVHLQSAGRMVVTNAMQYTLAMGPALCMNIDEELADAAHVEGTFRNRLEWTLGYFGAILKALEHKIFGESLAVQFVLKIFPLLASAEGLRLWLDHYAIVRHLLKVRPHLGGCASTSQVESSSSSESSTFTFAISSSGVSELGLGEGASTYVATSDTPESAAALACGRFLMDVGSLSTLQRIYTKREHDDFVGWESNLAELLFRMRKDGSLSAAHMAFHLVGDTVYSCTAASWIKACDLQSLRGVYT